MRGDWKDGSRTRTVAVIPEGAGRFRVSVDGAELSITAESLEGGRLRLVTPAGVTTAEVTAMGPRRFVRLGRMDFVFGRLAGARRRSAGGVQGGLEAPMPGVVTLVLAEAGDPVRKGQPLVAVEAMKMEHLVRAPRDGRVKSVRVKRGELVSGGTPLLELEEETSAG